MEELQRREAAAPREVDELRGEIARLGKRLAQAGERLSRLEITRETVAEIFGGGGHGRRDGGGSRFGAGRFAAGRQAADRGGTVPLWRPDLALSVLPPSYRHLLEVLADAGRPLRAGASRPRPG